MENNLGRVGYASLALGVPNARQRTLILKNASAPNLTEVIGENLTALDNILDYNARNGIAIFRVSSDIIPFGSHPEVSFPWAEVFTDRLARLGRKARELGMRLSMHPGQYTVLNSPSADVVERAVEDLRYHCRFLDLMGMDATCKLIVHVGGAYGDKAAAMERFRENYRKLDPCIRSRLILENDDKIFNIAEVLALGREVGAPVVFDNLHNAVNPSVEGTDEAAWIKACAGTWGPQDGVPKVHYSQQAAGKKPGSHSGTVRVDPFLAFARRLPTKTDVMLEVKDKNLSAVKCILCSRPGAIGRLEEEWARYKYAVLEHDPSAYGEIRALLKDKETYPAAAFYNLVDDALEKTPEQGAFINAAQHVWGYFKGEATAAEKRRFERLLEEYRQGGGGAGASAKRHLLRLAEKYEKPYLLSSYYFLFL